MDLTILGLKLNELWALNICSTTLIRITDSNIKYTWFLSLNILFSASNIGWPISICWFKVKNKVFGFAYQ